MPSLSQLPEPGAPRRVLVAEDNLVNRLVVTAILKKHGHSYVTVENGAEAVIAVQQGHFDVVLMDVQMPVLDGHDATRRIRRELGLTDLPIIALTAGALSSERQRAADAGMDYFILKPFSAEALVRSILRHVKRGVTAAHDVEGWIEGLRRNGHMTSIPQTRRLLRRGRGQRVARTPLACQGLINKLREALQTQSVFIAAQSCVPRTQKRRDFRSVADQIEHRFACV